MILLNFHHPLTEEALAQVEALAGQPVVEVRGEMPQFKNEEPLVKQVRDLLDRAGLSAQEWQIASILVNPPGFAPAAAVLMAEIHGRKGHFPPMLRMRPVEDGVFTLYVVAEVINLQAVREGARLKRN